MRAAFTLDARSLAVFRMAIGLILCADAVLRTRDFGLMFASDGMFPLDVLARFGGLGAWSAATLVDAAWWGGIVLAVEGIAGACLAAGVATRWSTVIAWVALVSVIRRTAPATNAGDYWLATMLLWSIFLPLGAVWSFDARRRPRSTPTPAAVPAIASWGTVALVLQIVAVYLSAGLSKCNESWWSGDAAAYALSVHDHGTRWGESLASLSWFTRGMTWGTLALELVAPVALLVFPRPSVRLAIVLMFLGFHMAICVMMTVGLFGYVGLSAWLALIPSVAWAWLGLPLAAATIIDFRSSASRLCLAALGIAAIAFLHDNTPWCLRRLPPMAERAVNALCLHQAWGMFANVPRQHQWVYSRAELADGRVVDVLRGGRPVENEHPTDGFLSLPHHRWHKLFWELPKPEQRLFAPHIAAALARHWNDRHGPDERIASLEIRFARKGATVTDDTLHELLLATWPPRDASGGGSLERLLRGASTGGID